MSRTRQRELVDAFLAANRDGDFEALLAILDPDVVVRADVPRGVGLPAGLTVRRGAAVVAAESLSFRRLAPGARPATVNGVPGLIAYSGGRLFGVAAFAFRGDRIAEIDFVLGAERLRSLGLRDLSEEET